ncbi:SCO family protein [Bosea vestrisii]|uniref:SCO family protein n=1 Tax=Bosea vestrisii TaxID=151416 RepID=UPI0024DF6176|nr:SCO family protein [Bosea vestrisii]WID94860.1 SCO family protein [Bosea vestrisii]
MPILKLIRYGAWTAVAVVAFTAGAILLGWWHVDGPGRPNSGTVASSPLADVGGAFSLTDHTGRKVTQADYQGKPALVFFGFTNCPEVCPTTLFELTTLLGKLGADADKLNVLFVTVDPGRDTPAQLALYLQSFDPRIVGLSGSQAEVDAALKAYKAYAKRLPTADGYTMDHTASVYLMDAEGRFRSLIDYHEEQDSALAKVRLLLKR